MKYYIVRFNLSALVKCLKLYRLICITICCISSRGSLIAQLADVSVIAILLAFPVHEPKGWISSRGNSSLTFMFLCSSRVTTGEIPPLKKSVSKIEKWLRERRKNERKMRIEESRNEILWTRTEQPRYCEIICFKSHRLWLRYTKDTFPSWIRWFNVGFFFKNPPLSQHPLRWCLKPEWKQ